MGKNNNRRNQLQLHEGSPPNPSNLPSQAEVSRKRNSLPQSHSLHTHQYNSFDPFLVSSESDSDNLPSTPTKANPPVRPAPKLSPRPTGKLARRRQVTKDAPSTPTPSKAMSVPRRREGHPLNLSRSVPSLSSIQPSEVTGDVFPICDDLTDAEGDDVFAPSTPIHPKGGSVPWLQSQVYDDGPRTAPLTNPYVNFPFHPKPTSTALERNHQHARSPSEGVFNLSKDEDNAFSTLSDASAELKAKTDLPRRRLTSAATTPIGSNSPSCSWSSSPSMRTCSDPSSGRTPHLGARHCHFQKMPSPYCPSINHRRISTSWNKILEQGAFDTLQIYSLGSLRIGMYLIPPVLSSILP
jgi:hypothetical protein